jgi:hypothetical protein
MNHSISKGQTTHVTVTAHMVTADLVDGTTVTALCGEQVKVNTKQTNEATSSGDYVVCSLCELAWELRDVQPPAPEQGSLF